MVTSASGFENGGGVSRTASTTAKIDAPAPSVSDSVKTAAAALAGERRRFRERWKTSTSMGGSLIRPTRTGPMDVTLLNGPSVPQQGHRSPLARAAEQQRISQGRALHDLTRPLVVARKPHAECEVGTALHQ